MTLAEEGWAWAMMAGQPRTLSGDNHSALSHSALSVFFSPLNLIDFYLYVMVSDFVFMGFLCVQICFRASICVSCAFSLALLFVLPHFSSLFLLILFIIILAALLYSNEKKWI